MTSGEKMIWAARFVAYWAFQCEQVPVEVRLDDEQFAKWPEYQTRMWPAAAIAASEAVAAAREALTGLAERPGEESAAWKMLDAVLHDD